MIVNAYRKRFLKTSLESETIMDLDLLREPRMETRLRLKFPVASVAKERPNIFLKVVEALRDCSLKNLKERDAYIAKFLNTSALEFELSYLSI